MNFTQPYLLLLLSTATLTFRRFYFNSRVDGAAVCLAFPLSLYLLLLTHNTSNCQVVYVQIEPTFHYHHDVLHANVKLQYCREDYTRTMSFEFDVKQANAEALAYVRKESLDIFNRLHSIDEDVQFVGEVHQAFPELPILRE